MGKDDAELRKEVELTEHQDSIEAVCRQYETDPDKGLSSAVAEEVRFCYFNMQYVAYRISYRVYVVRYLWIKNLKYF